METWEEKNYFRNHLVGLAIRIVGVMELERKGCLELDRVQEHRGWQSPTALSSLSGIQHAEQSPGQDAPT